MLLNFKFPRRLQNLYASVRFRPAPPILPKKSRRFQVLRCCSGFRQGSPASRTPPKRLKLDSDPRLQVLLKGQWPNSFPASRLAAERAIFRYAPSVSGIQPRRYDRGQQKTRGVRSGTSDYSLIVHVLPCLLVSPTPGNCPSAAAALRACVPAWRTLGLPVKPERLSPQSCRP